MLAAVQIDPNNPPCVIYWTGRVRLTVKVKTWCGQDADASEGVLQIPDDAKVCTTCTHYIETGKPNV